jgi:hypothetical protein
MKAPAINPTIPQKTIDSTPLVLTSALPQWGQISPPSVTCPRHVWQIIKLIGKARLVWRYGYRSIRTKFDAAETETERAALSFRIIVMWPISVSKWQRETATALNCQELIDAMTKKGYYTSPGGKTQGAALPAPHFCHAKLRTIPEFETRYRVQPHYGIRCGWHFGTVQCPASGPCKIDPQAASVDSSRACSSSANWINRL